MGVTLVNWTSSWSLILPYYEARVPAGFPSPADDYLERPLDLGEYLQPTAPKYKYTCGYVWMFNNVCVRLHRCS